MKHLTTYLLLRLGGNDSPSKDDITKALSAVGIQADGDDLDKMLAELDGKNLGELIASGNKMLATFGGGGGGGGSGGSGEEEKEKEKEEEPGEEPVDAPIGGADIFGTENGGDY